MSFFHWAPLNSPVTIIFRLVGPTRRYEQCRGSFSHVDAFDNTNINVADHFFFHIHVFWIKDSAGEYAGSMRTGASSEAGTIQINGEGLEYQMQRNQRNCAVYTRQ